ncbi:MAG: hypothetical protein PHR61_05180 [Candidatus Absconditabacteria bacterium]|nr:hypothetical protein [Candidatus Absconditabacteria bacterium]
MRKISFFAVSFSSVSDEQLVLEIQKGKVDAFEELYERRHKKIYAYLWNFLNYNYDDTVSLTSDVFIKLYEYVKENSLNNVKGFIYRLAHNLRYGLDKIKQVLLKPVFGSNLFKRDFVVCGGA